MTQPDLGPDRPPVAAAGRGYTEVLVGGDRLALRSLAGIAVMTLGAVVITPVLLLPVLLVGLWLEGGLDALGGAMPGQGGQVGPSFLLYVNLSIAALIPLSWLLARLLHDVRPRWLTSVAPGMRWRLLFACTGLSVASLLLALVVGALLPMGGDTTGVTEGSGATVGSSAVLIAVVVLLTTPLQAIGEEYAYRGYLMQAVGALARRPWVAVVVTSLVFALAHGAQNPPLFLDRFTFGIIAGTTVVLLGGLEAGIAMHVVNNVVAFSLAIATDSVTEALTVSEVSWWRILVTITQHGTYLLLVLWVARGLGVRRTTQPGVVPARGPA